MALRQEVIRQLVTDYQEALALEENGTDTTVMTTDGPQKMSQVIFEQVLRRTDNLLLKTVHKQIRIKPYMQDEEMRDLYHTAIIGLGRAMKTAKKETPGKMIARIIAYVRAELLRQFPLKASKKKHKSLCNFEPTAVSYIPREREKGDIEKIEHSAEMSMFADDCAKMIAKGVVDAAEFGFFVKHFAHEVPYRLLAKEMGCCEEWARWRVNKVMVAVREYFDGYEIWDIGYDK